ncbi:hypothetical protein DFH07DRAFT_939455 [Mycena maculata]|uniref:Uncharacterized protein n=1 Tax=Mycena maculata TaxID=230809 RepID=A0AAD7JE94_9AGAR|nr:hypothetical protein DFH07DRAFT_939455 [Mycena maculata]
MVNILHTVTYITGLLRQDAHGGFSESEALNCVAARQAPLIINAPARTHPAAECNPFLITWDGGTPPYLITVKTDPPGTNAVAEFDDLSDTSITWIVNATVDSALFFQVRDSDGNTANSFAFDVSPGNGDSCLGTADTDPITPTETIPVSTSATSSQPHQRSPTVKSSSPGSASTAGGTASLIGSTQSATPPAAAFPSTHSEALPTGAIAGIVVSILALILVAAFLFWLRRRRRRHRYGTEAPLHQPSPTFSLLSPGPDITVPINRAFNVPESADARSAAPISATTPPREDLADELRVMREKIADLEDLERRTPSTTPAQRPTPHRILRLVSRQSTSTMGDVGPSDLESQLSTVRQQNEALTSRILKLEEHMTSAPASEKAQPPPGYTAEPRNV